VNKICITGGCGFIGSQLAKKLDKQKLSIIDDLRSGTIKNLKGVDFAISKNITTEILERIKPDIIFHQAGITDTTLPDEQYQENVDDFKILTEYCFKNKIKLIYASSAAVYGNNPTPNKEGLNHKPVNAYGQSKLEMDKIATEYITKGANIIGLRYFNVYGQGEEHKGKSASWISHMINAVQNNQPITLFKHGKQKRDWIYISDVINANLCAMKKVTPGIYNIGTGKNTTYNKIAKMIQEINHKGVLIDYIDNPRKNSFQNNTKADTEKAKKLLKFQTNTTLKEGIKKYIKQEKT